MFMTDRGRITSLFSGLSLKIYSIIGLAITGMIGVGIMGYYIIDRDLNAYQRKDLEHLIESGVSIVQSLHAKVEQGELTEEEAQSRAIDMLRAIRYDKSQYFWINDMDARMVMHPIKPDLEGKHLGGVLDGNGEPLFINFVETARKHGSGFVDYTWPKPGSDETEPKVAFVQAFTPWNWVVGTGIYVSDLRAAIQTRLFELMLFCAAGMVVLLIAATTLANKITGPMKKMTLSMQSISAGDTNCSIEGQGRKDEIGDMAEALEILRTNTDERKRLESSASEENAAREERQKKTDALIKQFRADAEATLQVVSSNATQMEGAARNLTDISVETSQQADLAGQATDESSSNVEAIAAATEEMLASINEISSQIDQNGSIITDATRAASETDEKIAGLAQAAQSIGEVISLIQDIAEQTNLLALNATIEAARAGDAGKGFAVVAAEVKELAIQTSKATEDISSQISGIQTRTDEAVAAIRLITERIGSVNETSTSIAEAMDAQNTSTNEIAGNIHSAAEGTRKVKDVMSVVNEAVEQTNISATEVLSAAGDVASKADDMKQVVSRFLQEVAQVSEKQDQDHKQYG